MHFYIPPLTYLFLIPKQTCSAFRPVEQADTSPSPARAAASQTHSAPPARLSVHLASICQEPVMELLYQIWFVCHARTVAQVKWSLEHKYGILLRHQSCNFFSWVCTESTFAIQSSLLCCAFICHFSFVEVFHPPTARFVEKTFFTFVFRTWFGAPLFFQQKMIIFPVFHLWHLSTTHANASDQHLSIEKHSDVFPCIFLSGEYQITRCEDGLTEDVVCAPCRYVQTVSHMHWADVFCRSLIFYLSGLRALPASTWALVVKMGILLKIFSVSTAPFVLKGNSTLAANATGRRIRTLHVLTARLSAL